MNRILLLMLGIGLSMQPVQAKEHTAFFEVSTAGPAVSVFFAEVQPSGNLRKLATRNAGNRHPVTVNTPWKQSVQFVGDEVQLHWDRSDANVLLRIDDSTTIKADGSKGAKPPVSGDHYFKVKIDEANVLTDMFTPAKTAYFAASKLRNNGKLKPAIGEYTTAITLDPTYKEALADRASAYFELGQFNKAVQDLNAAINIAPHKMTFTGVDADKRNQQFNSVTKSLTAVLYERRAEALEKLNKHELATADRKKAAELKVSKLK